MGVNNKAKVYQIIIQKYTSFFGVLQIYKKLFIHHFLSINIFVSLIRYEVPVIFTRYDL